MAVRVAINGYGRIGRNVLRALYENGHSGDIQLVAVNASMPAETKAHLTRYDTAHGRFPGEVAVAGDDLVVNGDRITSVAERDPARLPWEALGVDVVLECTGAFRSRETALPHIQSGARKVLISAPGSDDMPTIVYGINHDMLRPGHDVVSNASCTTNCLAPLVKPLQDTLGIEHGVMNSIHSFTNDQVLTDANHKDLRRARSATHNMIPTKTGAAAAIGKVLPQLAGRLDGFAIRVPTINVSLVDLTFTAGRATSAGEVNDILRQAAEGELKGILDYNEAPLVSSDFNHSPASATAEASLTRVAGDRLVKVCAWYDNEWGFSCRMLDTALVLARV